MPALKVRTAKMFAGFRVQLLVLRRNIAVTLKTAQNVVVAVFANQNSPTIIRRKGSARRLILTTSPCSPFDSNTEPLAGLLLG